MITVSCTQCGTSIARQPYQVTATVNPFCGFACYATWQRVHRQGQGRKRVTVTCDTCGTLLERTPSGAIGHNFCNQTCFAQWRASDAFAGPNNPAWMGGHSEYRGPNWNRQSRAARARDNNTCQRCGLVGDRLPVHHKVPFRLFSDYKTANALDNLVTLCPVCHGITEQAFWQQHPELRAEGQFPDCAFDKACVRCGASFRPGSAVATLCAGCCTGICAHCGQDFYSRKAVHRAIKYCSRACRNAAIKRPEQVCLGCGATYQPQRGHTRYCSPECGIRHSNPRFANSLRA